MYGGAAAGLRKGGKEEGARKGGGTDTEERTKEKKERKDRILLGEAEGENFKKGEEGNGEET